MGLCANENRRRRPFKTIIIPRGIINPNENNIIEIPLDLDTNSSLIVKAPNDTNTCFSVEPYRGDLRNIPTPKYPTESRGVVINSTENSNKISSLLPETLSTIRNVTNSQIDYDIRPKIATVQSNFDERTKVNTDFSCQTPQTMMYQSNCFQQPCPQDPTRKPLQPPCSQEQTMGSLQPPRSQEQTMRSSEQPCSPQPTFRSVGIQQTCVQRGAQSLEAHSPLCPICARASCKFFSNAGINRPYKFTQFSSPLTAGQTESYNPYNVTTDYNIVRDVHNFQFPGLSNTRSETFSRSKERMENEILNRLLDDKIEKILKPVLFSLAKFSDDDETEIDQKCLGSCSAKYSTNSIQPRYTNYEEAPSSRRTNYTDYEYELFKRESRKRENDYGYFDNLRGPNESTSTKYPNVIITGGNLMPNRTSLSDHDRDYDSSKRRSVGADRDSINYSTTNCPPSASCQKRGSVSFNERNRGNSNENKTQEIGSDTLNTSFITTSDYSLTPRSSF